MSTQVRNGKTNCTTQVRHVLKSQQQMKSLTGDDDNEVSMGRFAIDDARSFIIRLQATDPSASDATDLPTVLKLVAHETDVSAAGEGTLINEKDLTTVPVTLWNGYMFLEISGDDVAGALQERNGTPIGYVEAKFAGPAAKTYIMAVEFVEQRFEGSQLIQEVLTPAL